MFSYSLLSPFTKSDLNMNSDVSELQWLPLRLWSHVIVSNDILGSLNEVIRYPLSHMNLRTFILPASYWSDIWHI